MKEKNQFTSKKKAFFTRSLFVLSVEMLSRLEISDDVTKGHLKPLPR